MVKIVKPTPEEVERYGTPIPEEQLVACPTAEEVERYGVVVDDEWTAESATPRTDIESITGPMDWPTKDGVFDAEALHENLARALMSPFEKLASQRLPLTTFPKMPATAIRNEEPSFVVAVDHAHPEQGEDTAAVFVTDGVDLAAVEHITGKSLGDWYIVEVTAELEWEGSPGDTLYVVLKGLTQQELWMVDAGQDPEPCPGGRDCTCYAPVSVMHRKDRPPQAPLVTVYMGPRHRHRPAGLRHVFDDGDHVPGTCYGMEVLDHARKLLRDGVTAERFCEEMRLLEKEGPVIDIDPPPKQVTDG